jgi:TetR/AcrR family transcriptional regulator, ethionamide resistance regulator
MIGISPGRIRRRPAEAEREILDAAEALLREGGFPRLTPAAVMMRTGLSRPSFYVYFRDVPDLLRRMLERIEGELFAAARLWLIPEEDPIGDARRSMEGIVEVYVRHGPVLRAVSDAAGSDPVVESLFRWGIVEHFVDAIVQRVEQEDARERLLWPVSRETVRALVLMNERYLAETLGKMPPDDPVRVAETLLGIWVRAVFGPMSADAC